MATRLLADAKPTEHNAYKRTLVERTIAAALVDAGAGGKGAGA